MKKILIFLVALLPACHNHPNPSKNLTKAEALKLAIKLANDECARFFNTAPFDSNSFGIAYIDDRWKWGELNIAGIDGFSAEVLFDQEGKNDSVQIYFSSDEIWLRRP